MFLFPLAQLQPSQLYISAKKLADVRTWWRPPTLAALEPIPIKRLGDCILYTDGHTRAFAAYQQGFTEVPVVWDEDDLDWEAYQICVDWCLAEGIRAIADLAGRVIAPEQYETLWHDRCRVMQAELAMRRGHVPGSGGAAP